MSMREWLRLGHHWIAGSAVALALIGFFWAQPADAAGAGREAGLVSTLRGEVPQGLAGMGIRFNRIGEIHTAQATGGSYGDSSVRGAGSSERGGGPGGNGK